jgi:hypothetical protein
MRLQLKNLEEPPTSPTLIVEESSTQANDESYAAKCFERVVRLSWRRR